MRNYKQLSQAQRYQIEILKSIIKRYFKRFDTCYKANGTADALKKVPEIDFDIYEIKWSPAIR